MLVMRLKMFCLYSKTCHKEDQKLLFKTDYSLMQVKSIAECSAILSTFFDLPFYFKTFVLLFLSGRLRQVLLYLVQLTLHQHTLYQIKAKQFYTAILSSLIRLSLTVKFIWRILHKCTSIILTYETSWGH